MSTRAVFCPISVSLFFLKVCYQYIARLEGDIFMKCGGTLCLDLAITLPQRKGASHPYNRNNTDCRSPVPAPLLADRPLDATAA